MIRTWTLAAALMMLASCGGGEAEKPAETPETPEAPAPPANPELPALDAASLAASAESIALVPSIVETQKALNAAGIEATLAEKIVERNFDLASKEDLDRVAVRTGVILADMLLTIKTAEDAELIAKLDGLNTGLSQLGGGADIQSTISDMKERLGVKALTRDEMLQEADELSGALIPELEFNGRKRTVPLIQAGSWLEGANLVAKSVPDDNPSAADGMLKQPAVVDYFIKYVKEEGSDKAPDGVGEKLLESLNTLKGLCDKAEPLTKEDIATIIKTTDDVLALL